MPSQVTIVWENDADFYYPFSYQTAQAVAISLSGAVMTMKLRLSAGDANVRLALTNSVDNGPGILFTNAPLGQFTIWITAQQLQTIPIGTYAISLVAALPAQNGAPSYNALIFSGSFTNNPGPSR